MDQNSRGQDPSSTQRSAGSTGHRPLARGALTCGLAAALTLAGAASAGAAVPTGGRGAPSSSGHSTTARSHGASDHSARRDSTASAQRSSTGATKSTTKSSDRRATAQGHRTSAMPATTRRAHDPAGNNGTIKIDGPAYDTNVDNEPHPSCEFRVTFFGFDAGQTADITITGIAPTGAGVLLHESNVPTSSDAAGGAAHDYDGATQVFTASDLGLTGVTPHPKQGYHLKVAVDSTQAPGGAKQKVLWLEPCTTTVASTTSAATTAATITPATAPLTTSGAPAPAVAALAADLPAATPVAAAAPAGAVLPASAAAPSAGTAAQSPSAAPASAQLPAGVGRPVAAAATGPSTAPSSLLSALPRTGTEGLALLLAGLGAVGAGIGLRVAGRRRPTPVA